MRALLVLLLVILAWGIGKALYDARSVQHSKPIAAKTEAEAPPAAEPPQTDADAEPEPQQQPSVPAASPATATESSTTEPAPPLDLSLPAPADNSTQSHDDRQQRLLPDLFDKDKRQKEQRLSVKAAPIIKPGADDKPLPKLDGVTVDVEMKTE